MPQFPSQKAHCNLLGVCFLGDYWTQRAALDDREGDSRGKELRRVGFALAQERYGEYGSSVVFEPIHAGKGLMRCQ